MKKSRTDKAMEATLIFIGILAIVAIAAMSMEEIVSWDWQEPAAMTTDQYAAHLKNTPANGAFSSPFAIHR